MFNARVAPWLVHFGRNAMATGSSLGCYPKCLCSILEARASTRRGSDMRTRAAVATLMASAGLLLSLIPFSSASAGAATEDRGSVVTIQNNVHLDPDGSSSDRSLPPCFGHTPCRQNVEVEFSRSGSSGTYKPPVRLYAFSPVSLGRVESFEVIESYSFRTSSVNNASFTYRYFVSVSTGTTTVPLTLREMQAGNVPSGVRMDVRCRHWTDTTGSLEASCRR
jgi:hypothetical protein